MRLRGLAAVFWLVLHAASADAEVLRSKLANGVAVVADRQPDAARIAACLTLGVGSSAEQPGEQGLARSLAHALSSDHFESGVGETRACIETSGSGLPAALARLASYVENAPGPAATADLPDPDLVARGRLRSLAYQGNWPIDHDALPTRQDAAELAAFHARTYAGAPAVVSLAGALPADWPELVTRSFARLPARPATPPPAPIGPPRQTSPRFMRLEHAQASAHVLYFGWAVGSAGTTEHHALTLIGHALGSGDAATLRSVFIKQRGMLRNASVQLDQDRLGNLFVLRLELKSNVAATKVEQLLSQVLRRIRQSGLTAPELVRARAALQQPDSPARAGSSARARELGSPSAAPTAATPSAAELKSAAALLREERQNVVELVPRGYTPFREQPKPERRAHVVKRGETLTGIARRHGVRVAEIVRANRLNPKAPLRIGQRLVIEPAAK
jgi:predicted Zn-dependent peptidase